MRWRKMTATMENEDTKLYLFVALVTARTSVGTRVAMRQEMDVLII
jgi:hypothetical protein